MAITISDSNNRLEDMEGAGPATTPNIGAGGGGGTDNTFFIEAAQAVSRKVTTTDARGFWAQTTSVDMTAGDDLVWLFKGALTDYVDVNSNGFNAFVSNDTNSTPSNTNSNEYLLHDDGTQGVGEFQYPILGGWIFEAIDPNVQEWVDVVNGTIDLTAVDFFGISGGLVNGAAKSTNIYLDSVDLGNGLYLVGSSPDGVYQDWVTDDIGTQTGGRFGHVRLNGGDINTGIVVLGKLIGGRNSGATSTLTVFTDSNKSLRWPGGRIAAGWNEHEWDLATSGTIITLTNCTYIGGGRDNRKVYFDTELQVTGGATDEIDLVGHGFASGDAILYSAEGGTDLGGLVDASVYFVERVDDDNFQLHLMSATIGRRAAFDGSTPVSLTAAGSGLGENHSFQRQPDTRPDLTITGNTGTYTANNCVWQRNRNLVLTSGATINAGTILECYQVTFGGAAISDVTFTDATTSEGISHCTGTVANVEAVTDCVFNQGPAGGHAIEVTGSVSALDISGLVFNNYGPDSELGNGHSFDTIIDIDDGNDEIDYVGHGFTTGDPVFYSSVDPTDGSAGTDDIGLDDGYLIYVRSVTVNSFSLHPTRFDTTAGVNKIVLNDGSTGETHTFYSADAAIVNNTGGDMTVNVSNGGSTPSIRNIGVAITTVVSSVSITITGLTEGSRGVMIGDGGDEDGIELLGGYATSAGTIIGSFSGNTPQNVIVKARNGGIINAAIQENFDAVFTDFTDAAREASGVNDVDLLPAVPIANDAFFFGGVAQFQEILINITTIGSGNTITWEYSTGSDAWSALTVTDGTSSFENAGWNTVSFTSPDDWAVDTINSQGPFFYVRARVTSVSTPVQPQAEEITLNDTVKYLPFESTGEIAGGTGLTSVAVWQEDILNP